MVTKKINTSTIVPLMIETLLNDQGNYLPHYIGKETVRDYIGKNKLPDFVFDEGYLDVGVDVKGIRTASLHRGVKDVRIKFPNQEIHTAMPEDLQKIIRSSINVFIDDKLHMIRTNPLRFRRDIMDLMIKLYKNSIQAQTMLITSVRHFTGDTKHFPRTQTEGLVYYSLFAIRCMQDKLTEDGHIK